MVIKPKTVEFWRPLGLRTGPDSEEYDSAQSVRIRLWVVVGQGHFTSVAQVTWRQFHSRVRLAVVVASAIERNIKLFGVVEQQFEMHLLSLSEFYSITIKVSSMIQDLTLFLTKA
jgi:hypothetical protein